ncbi:hypothetical protein [Pseudomonas gingeri]|uniref:Uncharacterized protein n=1 Tax=Pseudomonas gingeri TaxID=117681 RepID=A0A7Y7WCX2_9PSED|nr:hypothetical protein [Pseudomonas gingeri]NWB47087.1 hypothetical protein [Pseudomonas gingeri]
MSSEFKREDRYIVIKRKDLEKVPVAYRSALVDPMLSLLSHLPPREFVVIESDWPEYRMVWAMLEHRMAGKPVPNFNDWRRADELQQRLTLTDERVDLLEGLLREAAAFEVGENDKDAWQDLLSQISLELTPTSALKLTEADDDWHMNPCKLGHRDVGAAGGVAHCYTCDEKITAATTQESFEQWNTTHPAGQEPAKS